MVEFRTAAIVLVVLVVLGGLLIAKPNILSPQEDIAGKAAAAVSGGNAAVAIPSHAVEISPGVFFLGTVNKNGKMLEGYAFVDYKRGFGKPGGCNYDGKCNGWEDASCSDCTGASATIQCYSYLANGARWKNTEGYLLNPSNDYGLSANLIGTTFDQSISKWENASAKDIVGIGTATTNPLSADLVSTDGQNEVYFGNITDRNAIAITVVWGVFRGPPSQRELVEWDMIFDQADFSWSTSGESGKMDFEDIATHELGHVVGMDDLYESSCGEETMYGYADLGETKKRTLEAGDIAGVKALYGS